VAARKRAGGELLERGDELAALDAAITDLGAGGGGFAVIEGAAGIGKSSLLAEGRARAADAGLTVLRARGTEIERPLAFGVVRQLFEALIRTSGARRRAKLFEGAAAHARQLFEPARAIKDMPVDDDVEFTLLHGLYWLTMNLADQRPVLVSVDDLQWADVSSLRWLAYLVRRLDGSPVAVLATLRPSGEEGPELAELVSDPETARILPSALTPTAVAELVRTELSPDAEDVFCDACHRATGGNPLLLDELLRALAAEGVSGSADAVEVVDGLAPEPVARSVRLRLARLAPEARALGDAVAVLGDGAEHRHAAALAGLDRPALAAAAAALARADLLGPEPPLRFVHPVVRNAVYESRAAYERAQDHARAAGVLSAAGAPVEHVAAQLLLAPPETVGEAVAPLREAARRAAAEGAHESAIRFLGRALEERLDPPERAAMLVELAASEFRIGSLSVLSHLREAIALLDDPERRVRAELELGRVLYWAGQEQEGIEILGAALAERGSADDDLQHRLEAELMANATRVPSQYERARRRLAAVDVSAADGPGARMLLAIQAYHGAAQGGDREGCVDRVEQVVAAMEDDERAWNFVAPAYTLLFADRLDEGLRFVDRTLSLIRTSGAVFRFASLSLVRAIFEYARGDLAEAEADLRTGLDALPHRNAWSVPHAYGWLAQVLVERGELDHAAGVLSDPVAGIDAVSDPFARGPLLRARSLLAAARSEQRAALDDALELGRALSAYGHGNPACSDPTWRSLAALAHHALGDSEAATALAREDEALARTWGAPRPLSRSLRVLALLEGRDGALDRMRESVALLDSSRARLERAHALADLGAALRRVNRRAQAREVLRDALDLAQRSGAAALAAHAREELVATGARPRRAELRGVDSLTPSERRTAALAAEGMTNKQIAQALFVTLRTVEMHLSNVFRKLGISSRTQLAEALASALAGAVSAGIA